MAEIDNSGFFEQLRLDADIAASLRTAEAELRDVQFSLPNIRLPKLHKAAFSSVDLFRQQSNMTTFDYGLQTVLDALHAALNHLTGLGTPLQRFDFTMNFAGAASETEKRFTVKMRSPITETLELVHTIDANMQTTWQLVMSSGVRYFIPDTPPRILEPPALSATNDLFHDREARTIDFD